MQLKRRYRKTKNRKGFVNIKIISLIIPILLVFFISLINIFGFKRLIIFNISDNSNKKSINSDNSNKKSINSDNSNKTKAIDDYLSLIPEKYSVPKSLERERLERYFSLKVLSKNLDKLSDLEAKSELLRNFKFLNGGKNYESLKAIFVLEPVSFGNAMVKLNNLIYYCEVLGYKYIYLNSEYNWFIKEPVVTDKINISIIDKSKVDCNDDKILCFTLKGAYKILMYPINIKVEIRINILKDEIKRNLPQIKTDKDDLYIHFRAGSIFTWDFNPFYSQPPLCFYQKILNDFKFKKVYIIAQTNNNPVIDKLIEEYPNVIYKNNSLEYDIAYLSFSYNLVGSTSSFLQAILKINDNLDNYWEYDIYRMSEKFGHLHIDIYDFDKKFKIYKMKPSEVYKNEMFVWSKDENKLKLMIEDKCTYDFEIIEPHNK